MRWLWVVVLSTIACGDGSGLGPRDPSTLRTELIIESAAEGLSEAVAVDSASWIPAALLPTGDEGVWEVEGPFVVVLRNTAEEALTIRYDLRFLDDGGFLVDRFIPFGQPVQLAEQATSTQEGTFVIRTSPDIARYGLLTMRIAIRVSRPEP